MSMEMYVLSNRKLDDLSAWQDAIASEGFPLVLDVARPIQNLSGYLPATWEDERSGFECDHWSPDDFKDDPAVSAEPARHFALAFRWGGDPLEALAAWAAAAAYARAVDGVVFDGESGTLVLPQEAVHTAKSMERDLPAMRAMLAEIVRRFSKPA